MAITIVQLFEALSTTGLLSPAEVRALEASQNDKATANPEEVVRELVRTGKLTRYQGAAVFQGKAQTLVLGNYLLLDKIGAGGMGQVFRARHRKMDRIVALKVLPKKSLASPDAVERFQREVKAAARLTHGNIVTAHDADEAAGVHFLVMEYVEGTDLAGLVKSQGPLPIAQAVSCTLQAARGLQHAHAEGVIHRDIKPSNLLLDKRGRVKILDMGLARFSEPTNAASDSRDTATRSELTQTGSVMGTVDYMAPEQAVDTHQADHRADIYSLGCSLYYLLTGGPPYTGETMMKRLVAHREAPIPSLRAARPDVSAELDEVFRRMVAKNVANRYQSMDEVIGGLEKSARPQSAATAAPAPAPTGAPGRSRWPLTAGVAGVVVVLISAVLFFPRDGRDETAQVDALAAKQFDTLLPAGEKPASSPQMPEAAAPPAEPTPPPAASKPVEVPVASKPDESPVASKPVEPPPALPPISAAPAAAVPDAPPTTAVVAAPMEPTEPAAEPPAADRLAVPAAAAREAALQVIKQIFADDYAAAKTPEGKTELLKKLLAQASSTKDDPAARYVLLCEARDLAADLADTATVEQTAETLGSLYQVDPLAMQVEIYQRLAGKSRPAAGNKALAESALALAERAVEAENLDAAEQLLKVAAITAGKARAADLVKQAKVRSEELADQKREAEAVRKAEATLATNADDAAANLTLGKSLCFSQDDWEQGLPHLAKGSDSVLKALAAKSLPSPTDAAALADLADAWWDAAESHKGKEADPLRAGARHWYAAAMPSLSGIVKTKVEKRLADLGSSAGPRRNVAAKQRSTPESIELPLAPNVTLKFRLIQAGKFQMGSAEAERGRAMNEPQHEVTITKPFYMATTETTQAQWQVVVGNNPSHFQGDPLRPVDSAKWTDCQAFIARLNQSPAGRGYRFRLPTEAEWEYACRAGASTAFSFGGPEGPLAQYAWHKQTSDGTTHPVSLLQPNAWGLYDTHGNVWEWVSDWFNEAYGSSTGTDPRGPAVGTERTIRGGSYNNSPTNCRSATRGFKDPNFGADSIGFRLVCEPVGGFKSAPPSSAMATSQMKPDAKAENRTSAASSKPSRRGAAGPLAVAPFTADQARQFQESWAAALGAPATLSNSIGMQLTIIPAGEFMMGSSAEDIAALSSQYREPAQLDVEQPQHRVRVTRPYYLGMHEVTQQEYAAVTGKNPSAFSATGKAKDQVAALDTARFPVEMVSWNEAVAFCGRLSESPAERAAGRSYRLPTEAEWEFACRAGTTTWWNFSSDAAIDNNFAWWNGPVGSATHPVGTKQPNPFGLFDMHGNVQEVCLDWFDKGFYAVSPPNDPVGPPAGQNRVSRGGSVVNLRNTNRSAGRLTTNPDYHYPERGFRVVCVTPAMTAAKFIAPAADAKPGKPSR